MTHPPHLPNKTCSLSLRQLQQRLAVIILAVFFGLIAGLTGAIVTVGWIWPDFGGGNYWLVSQVDRNSQRFDLEDVIKREIVQKIFSVYNNTQKTGNVSYFDNNDKLGDAAIVGSDGWLCMYLENERELANYIRWSAVNFEGRIFKVNNPLYDKHSKMLYFKIKNINEQDEKLKNEQFKVFGFSEEHKTGEAIFVYQNSLWQLNYLDQEYFNTEKNHLDAVPVRYTVLEKSGANPGSLAVNKQGRLIGFVNQKGEIFSSIYVSRILSGVLEKQQIIYPSLMVEGWYSMEKFLVDEKGEMINGFLVTNILKNDTKLLKGDVVLEINGQIVVNENLWYNLRGEKARLKVLRRGVILDIETEIKENIFK